MSKRRRTALLALTGIAAAGLLALPSLWPPFRPYMERAGMLFMFAAGWVMRGRDRARQRGKAA